MISQEKIFLLLVIGHTLWFWTCAAYAFCTHGGSIWNLVIPLFSTTITWYVFKTKKCLIYFIFRPESKFGCQCHVHVGCCCSTNINTAADSIVSRSWASENRESYSRFFSDETWPASENWAYSQDYVSMYMMRCP